METMIGRWVIRHSGRLGNLFAEVGQAHLVESEVTDRLVMKCGRELRWSTRRGTFREFVARRIETRCKQCRGRAN